MNYDTIIERAAATGEDTRDVLHTWQLYPAMLTAAPFRSGFMLMDGVADSFRLIKLHGSTNWLCSFWEGRYAGQVYYVPTYSSWQNVSSERELEEYGYLSDKEPLIVPPLTEKTAYFGHETLRGMWREAGEAIRRSRRVFCIGYSLPPSDHTMRFFLRDNAPDQERTFYLVNPSTDSTEHFRKLLPDSFKLDDRFVVPDPVPLFAEAYCGRDVPRGESSWD